MAGPSRISDAEFDILKGHHRFLREDGEKGLTWNEQLASKYYSSLYREFAVCDLKHYKSGNFSLRWRTEAEVLAGSGESTCGNTRCPLHDAARGAPLTTLELPFGYEERGEAKQALVKVVLCARCVHKLMWKESKEKERRKERGGTDGGSRRSRSRSPRRTTSRERLERRRDGSSTR